MTSLDAYECWDLAAPIVIAVFLAILFIILVFVGCICYDCVYVPRIFIDIMQLNFPDLDAKKDKCDCSGSFHVDIDGSDINNCAIIFLAFFVVPLTVSTTAVTFWNVYLIEEEMGGDCVPNFDCFPMYRGNALQKTPVDNCSLSFDLSDVLTASGMDTDNSTALTDGEMEGDEDVEIHYDCYRFVFRYAEGIGAAGGVLFFTAAFSKLYFGLLAAISDAFDSSSDKLIKYGLSIFVWGVALVVWLLFVLLNPLIPMFNEAVFQTETDKIQFAMYAINFFMLVICGPIVSKGIWAKQ